MSARPLHLLIGCVCFALAPFGAWAERVVIIAPPAQGVEGAALSAELQDAIDRAFRLPGRYQRASEGVVMADELVAMFGCPRVEPDCARQAARAAEADLALLPLIERRGPAVTVRLELLAPGRLAPHHAAMWVIEPVGPVDSEPALASALRAAAVSFLRRDPPHGVLVPRDATGALLIDGRPWPAHQPISLRPGRHHVEREGWPARDVTVNAGEIIVLSAPTRLPVDAQPGAARYTAGWITAGAGVALLVAGAVVGGQAKATQRAYNTTTRGDDLDALADEGKRQAVTANIMFVASGLASATAAWLFWGP